MALSGEPETEKLKETKPQLVHTWFFLAWLIWFLLCARPTFSEIIHYQYFPAPEWLDQISAVGWSVGLVSAAFWTALVWLQREDYADKPLRFVFYLLVFFVLGLLMGRSVVTESGPMILAKLSGHRTQIHFVVVRADDHDRRRCRNPIELELADLFNELCRYPDSFRSMLRPGDKIALSGLGTHLGLFVESAQKGQMIAKPEEF
jgi:hypothetical protein